MNLSLGQKIKELRKARGLNQSQMAQALGVHLQTISRYERGELEPGPEVLRALAEKFNGDANFLLLKGQEISRTLPADTDFIILDHYLGYSRPEIHTKDEAIARVIHILEYVSEERVREVLAYVEEKYELVMHQAVSRGNRNDPVPDLGQEEKGKKNRTKEVL